MRFSRAALARAGLLAEAARQLTWRQAAARPRRLLTARILAGAPPRPNGFRPLARGLGVDRAPQSGIVPPPHLDGVFRALGRERAASSPDFWSREDDGLLFLFEIHGFGALARYMAAGRTEAGDTFWSGVLDDWLVRCGRPAAPAWHPFPLSGRVVTWCAALSSGGWDAQLTDRMVASLAWQLRFLGRSVEDDIGGNHVLRNACALVVGGDCCADASAIRRGERVLERELPRQILADGVHEERSTSYTRAVLQDLEDVASVQQRAGHRSLPVLDEAVARTRSALSALAGPDGMLPRLNDAWDGPPLKPSGAPTIDLAASGYVVLREGSDQAVLDVGPLCPPHLPPHAHADALSFVLWVDGRPVVIDPGSGSYMPEDRAWSRLTRAHATVEVDGQDQCLFWGAFRASKLPTVRRGPLDVREDCIVLTASHDGYRRLPDPCEHTRTFCWLPGDGLVVVDRLRAARAHAIVSTLPISSSGLGPVNVGSLGGREVLDEPGRSAPVFGVYEDTRVLRQRTEIDPREPFGWVLTRSTARVEVSNERVAVHRPGLSPVEFHAPF